MHVVYGRNGNFRSPQDSELLANSLASFVGVAGAGIGRYVSPVGDVNGDSYNDLLIGDATNQRAFLVFGQNAALGSNVVLDSGHPAAAASSPCR